MCVFEGDTGPHLLNPLGGVHGGWALTLLKQRDGMRPHGFRPASATPRSRPRPISPDRSNMTPAASASKDASSAAAARSFRRKRAYSTPAVVFFRTAPRRSWSSAATEQRANKPTARERARSTERTKTPGFRVKRIYEPASTGRRLSRPGRPHMAARSEQAKSIDAHGSRSRRRCAAQADFTVKRRHGSNSLLPTREHQEEPAKTAAAGARESQTRADHAPRRTRRGSQQCGRAEGGGSSDSLNDRFMKLIMERVICWRIPRLWLIERGRHHGRMAASGRVGDDRRGD